MGIQKILSEIASIPVKYYRDRIETGPERHRRLTRLLPVDPAWLDDRTAAGHRRVLRLILRALRSERTRGRAGHWTYSLDRHAGLLQAFQAERRLVRAAALAEALAEAGPSAHRGRRISGGTGPEPDGDGPGRAGGPPARHDVAP